MTKHETTTMKIDDQRQRSKGKIYLSPSPFLYFLFVVSRSFVCFFFSYSAIEARHTKSQTNLKTPTVCNRNRWFSLEYCVIRHKRSTTVTDGISDRKENHEVIVARAATYAIRSCRQSGVHCLPESPVGSRSSTLFAWTACLLARPPSPYRTTLWRSMYDGGAQLTRFFSLSALRSIPVMYYVFI